MRIDLSKRKQAELGKKKGTKKDKKNLNKVKNKYSKKNLSSINVSERKKPNDSIPTSKTNRATSKSYISSAKQSKPISAR